MITVTCAGCGDPFEARRLTAKWCSDRCRKAEGRARPEPDPSEPPDTGLVDSVRRELEAADRLDTWHGQLALQLAQRLTRRDETGISSMAKELQTVMASALQGVTSAPAEAEPEDDDPVARAEDELARKRGERTAG